jgi:hypothetical protein
VSGRERHLRYSIAIFDLLPIALTQGGCGETERADHNVPAQAHALRNIPKSEKNQSSRPSRSVVETCPGYPDPDMEATKQRQKDIRPPNQGTGHGETTLPQKPKKKKRKNV